MESNYNVALFIFRRDLRFNDNKGLAYACSHSNKVITCFIVDPRQVEQKNEYRSLNAIQFMFEAVQDLAMQLQQKGGHLYILYGRAEDIVDQLLTSIPIDIVISNRDYTPFAIKRDEAIKKICYEHNCEFYQDPDTLLNEPEAVISSSGSPYVIFTPFFKRARQLSVSAPIIISRLPWYTKRIDGTLQSLDQVAHYNNASIHVHGTRALADKILTDMSLFEDYGYTHDIPSIQTTNLSAYIKFGIVSIREVYYAIVSSLGAGCPIIRQLYWRDFFTHVAYHSPFVFGAPFKELYKNLPWQNDNDKFQAWCDGMTGFPIVDAGMRQLNETGYMHNRVRLVTASFLVKDLHIDWRMGEKYFAQQLVDYDPAVNNGNWQWVASTGADSQPYFRIFNPWLQQKKFDAQCIYIKQWIPELSEVKPNIIHTWHTSSEKNSNTYVKPIVDHSIECNISKFWYKSQ